jgi:hypothetical protein
MATTHRNGMIRLESLPAMQQPIVRARCRELCDQSNAHFRKVAPSRFPDALPCTYDGLACQACVASATP